MGIVLKDVEFILKLELRVGRIQVKNVLKVFNSFKNVISYY